MNFDQWYKRNMNRLADALDKDGLYGVAKLSWEHQQKRIDVIAQDNIAKEGQLNPDRMGQ